MASSSWLESLQGSTVAVTGGAGYVGECVIARLLSEAVGVAHVVVVDVNPPREGMPGLGDVQVPDLDVTTVPSRLTFVKCDISLADQVDSALAGKRIACVIHLASFGMSGAEMVSNPEKLHAINVGGTENVIAACRRQGIGRLVYISTYNVVFGRDAILGGDESSVGYLPMDKHFDAYSRTKSKAEQLVLSQRESNDQGKADGGLAVAVVRPAAIYGENEGRHLPRIAGMIEAGMFRFAIGDATVDWVHTSNLSDGIVRAACGLAPGGPSRDQVYFISDNSPMNNFAFLQPLADALGCPPPCINLPFSVAYGFAAVSEAVHRGVLAVGGPWLQPLMTRAEVCKVGVSHYFAMDKAARELGYRPAFDSVEGGTRLCAHYRKLVAEGVYKGDPRRHAFRVVPLANWIVLFALVALALLYTDATVPVVGVSVGFALIIALTIHFLEAAVAAVWCRCADMCTDVTVLWVLQSFVCGVGSLSLLARVTSKPPPTDQARGGTAAGRSSAKRQRAKPI
eukprot:m.181705 g.181705  ORF g.181705 m.181705 type:complete len:511 (-) comp18045_c0_seq3:70-1602(-)